MLPTPPRPDQAKEPLFPDSEEESGTQFGEEGDDADHDDGSDQDTEDLGPDGSGPEEPDPGDGDDLITVATFRTAPEAELAKTALDAEGIVAFIADAETVTMDWLLGVAVGDVKVQVARSVAAQRREFLAQHRKTHELDDAPGTATCLACGAHFPDEQDRCSACGWSFDDD